MLARVIDIEKGLSLDPSDPGNWTSGVVGQGELHGTKFGISAHAYPLIDIAALTQMTAEGLYKRDYFGPIHGDDLPPAVAFQVFDFAVHAGVETAIMALQRAVGVIDDGHWGPISKAALASHDPAWVICRLLAERLDLLTIAPSWWHDGKGWARRIARNLRDAAADTA